MIVRVHMYVFEHSVSVCMYVYIYIYRLHGHTIWTKMSNKKGTKRVTGEANTSVGRL